MKNVTKAILCVVIISILAATSIQAAAAEPSVGAVTLIPSNPTVQSNVTVTAKITGDDITSVYLLTKECDDVTGICKNYHNISMTETSAETFEAIIPLAWDKATYMTYWFEINSLGTWTKTEYVNVTLLPASGNNNTNGTNGDGNNKTPGFELLIGLTAIGFILILVGRKRFR